MQQNLLLLVLQALAVWQSTAGYSALEDSRIIAAYKRALREKCSEANVVRRLVHQADWASFGTISTDTVIEGYPMVNIVSIDDNTLDGESTGIIRFLLTDLDFTGKDVNKANKVTLLFSDNQRLICKKHSMDPMEPTCPRAIISGTVKKLDNSTSQYENYLKAFIKRHPASTNWLKNHAFYLNELNIENIIALDNYGGAKTVTPECYYDAEPEELNEVIA